MKPGTSEEELKSDEQNCRKQKLRQRDMSPQNGPSFFDLQNVGFP
jgi:hypothetical protein